MPTRLGSYAPARVAVRYAFRDVGNRPRQSAGDRSHADPPDGRRGARDFHAADRRLDGAARGRHRRGHLVQVAPPGTRIDATPCIALRPGAGARQPRPAAAGAAPAAVRPGHGVAGQDGRQRGARQRQRRARQPEFTLKKSPAHLSGQRGGVGSTLAVYVDGIHWTEVPSFYGQPADAQVFVIERSPDQSVTTSASATASTARGCTSGTGNVVATYRYGSGAAEPAGRAAHDDRARQPNLARHPQPGRRRRRRRPEPPRDVKTDAPARCSPSGARSRPSTTRRSPRRRRASPGRRPTGPSTPPRSAPWSRSTSATTRAASPPPPQALAGSDDPNRPVAVAAAHADRRVAVGDLGGGRRPGGRRRGRRGHRRLHRRRDRSVQPRRRWASASGCTAASSTRR